MLIKYLKGYKNLKHLCSWENKFKIPAHVRFVDKFSQTATGKIQKHRLRELAIVELQDEKEEKNE